jgi:hypothetical protein
MRANIRLSLFKLFPVQLLALLDNVIAKMTGNTNFPTPPISLTDLGALRDKFQTSIEAATGGAVKDKKERDKQVLEVRDALRVTADYQRATSNGDAAILATGGFELKKFPQPIGEVGKPNKVVATATTEARKVHLRWNATTGARMFRVEQAESDPTVGETKWNTIGMVGRQSFTVEGLTSYQPCWFRITALGIASEGLPSDVVLGRAA